MQTTLTETAIRVRRFDTPFGPFLIRLLPDGTLSAQWADLNADLDTDSNVEDPDLMPELAGALEQYFAGHTDVDFSMVPTPTVGPPFHLACWKACRRIPLGETVTYAKLAEMAGRPGAARAAGQAMRHNPLTIIVPCHRVISSSGNLHGYDGSTDPKHRALQIKSGLLALEQQA